MSAGSRTLYGHVIVILLTLLGTLGVKSHACRQPVCRAARRAGTFPSQQCALTCDVMCVRSVRRAVRPLGFECDAGMREVTERVRKENCAAQRFFFFFAFFFLCVSSREVEDKSRTGAFKT